MNPIDNWATKWNIPKEALDDLHTRTLPAGGVMPPGEDSEFAVMNRVRLEAAKAGVLLWRNNTGVAFDAWGHTIRFGLANDSKAINSQFKSSDLIGVRPRIILPEDIGQTIGQFVAREVKAVKWKYRGNKTEKAQRNFLEILQSKGADAQFVTGVGSL